MGKEGIAMPVRALRALVAVLLAAGLAACQALQGAGPRMDNASSLNNEVLPFDVIDLTPSTVVAYRPVPLAPQVDRTPAPAPKITIRWSASAWPSPRQAASTAALATPLVPWMSSLKLGKLRPKRSNEFLATNRLKPQKSSKNALPLPTRSMVT